MTYAQHNRFLLCRERINEFENSIDIGGYKFQYGNTDAFYKADERNAVLIFGKFVNCHDIEQSNDALAQELLESEHIDCFIKKSKKLAGRFVLLFQCKSSLYVVPDACASIHVAYTTEGDNLFVSSNPKMIADLHHWEESELSKKIKSSGAVQYPLPYDMTMYDQIKMVIPNHYLACDERKSVRYYPAEKVKNISIDEAAEKSSVILQAILNGFHKKHRLSLPLTAGADSRKILACCRDFKSEIPVYTFLHKGFNEKTADIRIPKEISEKHKLDYRVIKDIDLPSSIAAEYKETLGSCFNPYAARLAWTYYNSELSEYVYLSGDIGPLARSSFGANLPEFLAKTSYLSAKTHNFSKENKKETSKWIGNVKENSKTSGISKYDLFFWEHRCGKWAANTFINTDLLVSMINPFNCRELIEIWLSVPRQYRNRGVLQRKIMSILWPELLNFPINPGSKSKTIRNHTALYYMAVRVKYALHKLQFLMKSR